MAIESTISYRREFGVVIQDDEDIIECAIFECCDFMYRHEFWIANVAQNIHPHDSEGFYYIELVVQSIRELELIGWQFEPVPGVTVSGELELWLSLL